MNHLSHAIEVLQDSIKQDLKKHLIKQITEQLVEEFRKEVAPVVAEAVKDVSLEYVEAIRQACSMREELHLHINNVEIK